MLVMVLVALQLAACGGKSNGETTTSSVSSSNNLALSNAPSTASTSKVDSSTAPPTSSTPPPAPSTGVLRLSWTAPVSRSDGSPLRLSEIDGFHIYLGKAPNAYTSQVNVANGAAQSVTVTKLAPGTYYLVMTTYDMNGLESGYSPVISKTVL